jgi:ATP-dependent DNA helicase PIF1
MTQDEALALLKAGTSIFLTGPPGSGKTHTVNRYIDHLRRKGLEVAFTASTGIAATHGHGVTIHAWSGIGVREMMTSRDLDGLATNRRLADRIERTSVLVIDEISMLPARSLTLVDAVCRHFRGNQAPLGGLQIVLVGDFFQLPPIVRRQNDDGMLPLADGTDAYGAEFAHASPAWRDLAPTVCYLSEQHRQSDQVFADVLAAIRSNACTGDKRQSLTERLIDRDRLTAGCTRLFTHNATVDEINLQQLAKLGGKPHVFGMMSKGPEPFVRALQRGCLSPESLKLKQDAVVLFTKNDPAGRFVNGTLGVVAEFDEAEGHPVVRTRSGRRIVAEPAKWKIEENGKERASITQLPLRLAWAMTVHKSQGMSLDAAVIDLSKAFEYGQGYVALSRLRELSGLHLLGLNERALRVHPAAVEKDAEFRTASEAARPKASAIDLAPQQEAFLAAFRTHAAKTSTSTPARGTAPARPRMPWTPRGAMLDAMRATHAKAYAPWSREEDFDLKRRHQAGETVDAIASHLGRKPGAIRSRLKKLALI